MLARRPSVAKCFLILLLAGTGCSSITVHRAEGPAITGAWRVSAVTGTELSARSLQTMRRYNAESLYPSRLAEAVSILHSEALRDPNPDLLFALSEINFLRGTQAEHKHKPESVTYYYLA